MINWVEKVSNESDSSRNFSGRFAFNIVLGTKQDNKKSKIENQKCIKF
jgi:hypothetical protein